MAQVLANEAEEDLGVRAAVALKRSAGHESGCQGAQSVMRGGPALCGGVELVWKLFGEKKGWQEGIPKAWVGRVDTERVDGRVDWGSGSRVQRDGKASWVCVGV